MTVEDVQDAVNAFERTAHRFARQGAEDTEPDGVFQSLLVMWAKGLNIDPPAMAESWKLYDEEEDSYTAARALYTAAVKVRDAIRQCPVAELRQLRAFIKDYCWRC